MDTSNDRSLYIADIEKYFERSGYVGSREPTLETLKGIVWSHNKTFPFESLDIHLGRPIYVDLKSVEDKLVFQKRGGLCFEQTVLLINILRQLHFAVTPLIGRVVEEGYINANTHAIMKVECEGKSWLVDCGFGSNDSTVPLEINDKFPVFETPICPHRVVRNGDIYTHQMKSKPGDDWDNLYTFTMNEVYEVDYEVSSWYCTTLPKSFFTDNIIVTKFTQDKRFILFNKTFKYRAIGPDSAVEDIENREIDSQGEYLRVLREYFSISLPEGTVLCPPNMSW